MTPYLYISYVNHNSITKYSHFFRALSESELDDEDFDALFAYEEFLDLSEENELDRLKILLNFILQKPSKQKKK